MNAILMILEHSVMRSLGWALLHFVWQAIVITGFVAVLHVVMRRASSRVRYLALCGAMAVMAASPVVTWCWIAAELTPIPRTPVAYQSSTPESIPMQNDSAVSVATVGTDLRINDAVVGTASAAPMMNPGPAAGPFEPSPSAAVAPPWSDRLRGRLEPNLPWLVTAWLIGVLVLSIRLLAGWRIVQRLRRDCVTPAADAWQLRLNHLAARLGISRSIRLVESALVDVPTVIGWLRPMILLPVSFLSGLTTEQVEAVLAHELAHIRRHDFLVNLIQTTIEVLLFYHPAVWWLSRRMRDEREHCCDDIAVTVCGSRVTYVRALATMEEIRSMSDRRAEAPLSLAANGGSLLQRIRRLAICPTPDVHKSTWWGASLFAMSAVGGLGLAAYTISQPKIQAAFPITPAIALAQVAPAKPADSFGPVSNGIRSRLVAVPASTDNESPDVTKTAATFARNDDLTFAVELKNVSEQPITLLGMRYGESYAGAAGKLNTEFFAPHLFEFDFTDSNGKPVPRASRVYEREMMVLSGASAHAIAPGKSLVVVLRPAKFSLPMDHRLASGQYRAKIRYHGPSPETVAEIKKHWPDKPQASAWTHEVASNEVAFTIADNPNAPKPAKLEWGTAKDGLQTAIEFRLTPPAYGAIGVEGLPGVAPGIPIKTAVGVFFHVKNVSDKVITFASETGRQGDTIHVTNTAGEEVPVRVVWFSGWPILVRWTLKPGEVAELHALATGIDTIEQPGQYTVRYTIRFNSMQTKDAQGNITFPLKGDWQSEIDTGDVELFLRERTPEDDARERPPTFVGRIEIVGPNGRPVESGTFTLESAVLHVANSRSWNQVDSELQRGPIKIPGCTLAPASLTIRAPGFEEAVFVDIKMKPSETKRFELIPAAPTRFKLVSAGDGQPIADAKIRFFNKTSGLASSGPIPMHGLAGPVWATSQADGSVVLDTLMRIDPYYAKLGDAIYFFCIDAPAAADAKLTPPPRVVGPIKAGQDLGEIKLGPPLEVRGEIRGTPEELKRFAAEWDQPFAMKTDNPEATWDYAVSKRLETKQEDDKLTFHLTGLTPGRVRIISNFGPHPHSVSHTYARRDPKEGDVVVTVELIESLGNLVITSKGREVAKP